MPHHPFFAPQLPPDAKEGQDQRHGRASAERHGGEAKFGASEFCRLQLAN